MCLLIISLRPLAYVAVQKLTIVDFFYLPYGDFVTKLGYDHLTNETKWPNVARWWKDITSRESYKAVKDGIPTN
jgi:glutathione S-transferase